MYVKTKSDTTVSLLDSDGVTVEIREVLDSFGVNHSIGKEIGKGGQGLVCHTQNPEIVVKFALGRMGTLIDRVKNPLEFTKANEEFKSIIYKPFPERIHVAYPMARLADYAGYVMRFMDDMVCYSDIVPLDESGIRRMSEDGGHRRRFELLFKLAAEISKLHGAGMVYCDLSPRNVYVTADPKGLTQNVWLIDADNIFIPGEDADKLVYTARYAAPELLSGMPCSQASDVYSFAVLAFESLAALHPFAGERAMGVGECNWDETEAAGVAQDDFEVDLQYSGKIPWVEDAEDKSNHTKNGLPLQTFLTGETFELFNMTFSECGRTTPKTRPTAMLWARAFAHSYMQCVRCPDCNMSFVYDSQEKCPWCDENLPQVLILKDETGRMVFAHEIVFCDQGYGEEFYLHEHVVAPFKIDSFFSKVLKLRTVNENGLGIEFRLVQENSAGREFAIVVNDVEERILSAYILQPKKGETYSLKCYDKETGLNVVLAIEMTGRA